MRSRILPDEHPEQQQQQQKPLLLSKKTNALFASWDRRQRAGGGAGSLLSGGGGHHHHHHGSQHPHTMATSLSPRHPFTVPRTGSHKDRSSSSTLSSVSSSSVWTVKLPKRMLYTVMGVFVAIPLLIFFWKEIHVVPSNHQHGLRNHGHPGELSLTLSEMDRLKATWLMEGEQPGGEGTTATTSTEVQQQQQPSSKATTTDPSVPLVSSNTTTTTINTNHHKVLGVLPVLDVGKNDTNASVTTRATNIDDGVVKADSGTATVVGAAAAAALGKKEPVEPSLLVLLQDKSNNNINHNQNDVITDELLPRVMDTTFERAAAAAADATVQTVPSLSDSGVGGVSVDDEEKER